MEVQEDKDRMHKDKALVAMLAVVQMLVLVLVLKVEPILVAGSMLVKIQEEMVLMQRGRHHQLVKLLEQDQLYR